MNKRPLNIVITGTESTGKSTLAQQLAHVLNACLIPEFAREYLAGKNGYSQHDLTAIAAGQLKLQNQACHKKIKICDTDLQVIKIWSMVKYNNVDEYISREYKCHLPDAYILCLPDFEWQYDPLRENKYNRDIIHTLYVEELTQLGLPFIVVGGSPDERKKLALTFVHNNFM